MTKHFATVDVGNMCRAIAMGYSVVNERQIVINKAVVPQFDKVAEGYFINRIAVIRTAEGIDDKSCNNKIGTKSVLQLVPIAPNVIYVT